MNGKHVGFLGIAERKQNKAGKNDRRKGEVYAGVTRCAGNGRALMPEPKKPVRNQLCVNSAQARTQRKQKLVWKQHFWQFFLRPLPKLRAHFVVVLRGAIFRKQNLEMVR